MTRTNNDLLNESIRRRRYKETLVHIVEADDLNSPDSRGDLPLVVVASMKSSVRMDMTKIMRILVKNGADVNASDPCGLTALMCAAEKNLIENMVTLLALGSDPDAQDQDGTTAMMRAAYHGKLKAVKTLVAHGASVEVYDAEKDIAWDYAICGKAVYSKYFLFRRSLPYLLKNRNAN